MTVLSGLNKTLAQDSERARTWGAAGIISAAQAPGCDALRLEPGAALGAGLSQALAAGARDRLGGPAR